MADDPIDSDRPDTPRGTPSSSPPPTGNRGANDARGDELASWYRMAGIGIEFVVAIALFTGLGYLADRWLGTAPWLLIVGAALGFAVGLRAMIKMAMKSFKS